MKSALQQMGLMGYSPAPATPAGGVEVGAYGAPHVEGGAQGGFEVGYYTINGYPQIGAHRYAYYPRIGDVPASMTPVPSQVDLSRMSDPSQTMHSPQFVGGRQVTEWQPTIDRVLWLGFKLAGILSTIQGNANSQPQDTFAPRKVVIPGSVAPNFEVNDIKVGAISQLSSNDPIPAEAFIPNAQLTDVHFDTAKISQNVTFVVTNISNATATFRASMNGFVVR